MSYHTFDMILVALKAMVDRNVNFNCWQSFVSSEIYGCQECKLALLTGLWWLSKLRVLAPAVARKHSVFQVLGGSKNDVVSSNIWWET